MMFKAQFILRIVLLGFVMVVSSSKCVGSEANSVSVNFQQTFFKLCELACEELPKDTLHVKGKHHYKDSYAVRALCVAYDLTGDKKYLNTCRQWSDKMLTLQKDMAPAGAYYMNYGRKPGQTAGDWFVADTSSIAMAVLATSVRCDGLEKKRYIDSVRLYADLVINNYVRPSGGVTDGIWQKSDKEWWCSTGIFGSLAFLLYGETGDEKYFAAGLRAIDWLNNSDFSKVGPSTLEEQSAAMIMYYFEAYSAGWNYIQPCSQRMELADKQFQRALGWMKQNQATGQRGNAVQDYNTQWGSKFGGLPFHMYVLSSRIPDTHQLASAADRELAYIITRLGERDKPAGNRLSQLMQFSMMSLAQKLSPGAIYRASIKNSL